MPNGTVVGADHRSKICAGAKLGGEAQDLLELNGKDLRPLPLGDRKAKLALQEQALQEQALAFVPRRVYCKPNDHLR
jgi:hypothetical protein